LVIVPFQRSDAQEGFVHCFCTGHDNKSQIVIFRAGFVHEIAAGIALSVQI
jgi:hypothetical protein